MDKISFLWLFILLVCVHGYVDRYSNRERKGWRRRNRMGVDSEVERPAKVDRHIGRPGRGFGRYDNQQMPHVHMPASELEKVHLSAADINFRPEIDLRKNRKPGQVGRTEKLGRRRRGKHRDRARDSQQERPYGRSKDGAQVRLGSKGPRGNARRKNLRKFSHGDGWTWSGNKPFVTEHEVIEDPGISDPFSDHFDKVKERIRDSIGNTGGTVFHHLGVLGKESSYDHSSQESGEHRPLETEISVEVSPWSEYNLDNFQIDKLMPDFGFDWENLEQIFKRDNEKWWKGRNVCVTREHRNETEGEDKDPAESLVTHHMFTQSYCDETESAFKCKTEMNLNGKKRLYTVTYQCCHGYHREQGKKGCTKVVHLDTLTDTLEELSATEMKKALVAYDLMDTLIEGNYTVFAPVDSAFVEVIPPEKVSPNVIEITPKMIEMADKIENILSAHILPGIYSSKRFDDELVVKTLNPNAVIRMNFYDRPKTLIAANCVPVSSSDHMTKNGVVHTVNKILTPVTDTLMELIDANPDLSTLREIITRAGMSEDFNVKQGQSTLFAPTNEAFSRMDQTIKSKIMRNKDCLKYLIENHILPRIVCSAVIDGQVKTVNVLRKQVTLARSDSDRLSVNNASLLQTDVMGLNGVIHVINEVLLPKEALDVLDVAKQAGATHILELVEKAGLNKTLTSLSNFTIFLPTNKAFSELPQNVQKTLRTDSAALAKMLRYHIVPNKDACKALSGSLLPTMEKKLMLRYQKYSSSPFKFTNLETVQCATIVKKNLRSCGSVAHIVNKVLMPPSGDIIEELSQNSDFSELSSLLKLAGMREDLHKEGPFTFFAPTNKALAALAPETMDYLKQNVDQLKDVLKQHIVQEAICCSGVFERNWFFRTRKYSLAGTRLSLHRENSKVEVDGVTLEACDIMANNGIIHAVDKVIVTSIERNVPEGHRKKPDRWIWSHLERMRRIWDKYGRSPHMTWHWGDRWSGQEK